MQAQSSIDELNNYVTRCISRIKLVVEEDTNHWPSPKTITLLSSGSASSISAPHFLTQRKTVKYKNDKEGTNVADEKALISATTIFSQSQYRSVFSLMTRRVDVLIHDYLCRIGFLESAQQLEKHQHLEVGRTVVALNSSYLASISSIGVFLVRV